MLRHFLPLCWALLAGTAAAQSSQLAGLPLPQYPPGSIRSIVQADRALLDVRAAQLAQEKAFLGRRQACYAKLVAESCLIDATEDNVKAERRIRAIQVEAREFKRRDAEREAQALRAAKRELEAADAPQRRAERERTSKNQKEHVDRKARAEREFEAGAEERRQRAAAEKRRLDQKQDARVRKAAQERASVAERAERVRAHEEKVSAVLQRAQEKEARARQQDAASPSGLPAKAIPKSPAASTPDSPAAGPGKS